MTTLNQSYIHEIKQAFKVFDEERTGYITINSFKLLIRALGFRVTKHDVLQQVYYAKQRQGILLPLVQNEQEQDEALVVVEEENDSDVDLDIVLDVMNTKYSQRDEILEMKMNFRLFDVNNDGFIDLHDLTNVVDRLNQQCQDLGLDDDDDEEEGGMMMSSCSHLDKEQLMAMIDEFDNDLDGMISQEDFCRIVQR